MPTAEPLWDAHSMTTYFTSDTHFAHENLINKMGRKGFYDWKHHDEELLNNINETVDRNDTLVIAGDFSWGNPQKYRQRIRCKTIRFVIGNHDKPKRTKETFGTYSHIQEIKTKALGKVVVCHYPIIYWPRSHRGAFHVYGHTHQKAEPILDAIFPQRKSMDIGIDNAIELLGKARPFSEEEIYEILKDRTGHHRVNDAHEAEFISSLRPVYPPL